MRAGTEHDVAVETAFDIQLHRVFPFRGIDPGSGEVEQDRLAFPEVLTTPFEVFGNETELRRLAERAHEQQSGRAWGRGSVCKDGWCQWDGEEGKKQKKA